MIQAKDLRIGNIMLDGAGREGSVSAINQDRIWMSVPPVVGFSVSINFPQNVNPIPLTEEWLVRFGFSGKDYRPEYIGVNFKSGWHTLDFVLTKPKALFETQIHYTYELQANRIRMLEYVHQLQNLYYALTGEELTIK